MSEWGERLVEQRSAVRLLIDENLPPSLKFHLQDLFPDSVHVRDVDLANAPDASIWQHAKAFGLAILTKDTDFVIRARQQGPPPTVIRIRAGNSSVQKLVTLLRENAPQITTEVQFGGALLEIGKTFEALAAQPPKPVE